MITAEFMLSKRPVLRFTAALFFLLNVFLFDLPVGKVKHIGTGGMGSIHRPV